MDGIAFLIDEFEDVALGRRLSKKQASDYIATLRRLLDTAREEDFWLVLSMTPEGYDQTDRLDPSLMERFSQKYEIPRLSDEDATQIVAHRLKAARHKAGNGLWPLRDDAVAALKPTTRSSPRRLIKVLWQALATAATEHQQPPISNDTLTRAEAGIYPGGTG